MEVLRIIQFTDIHIEEGEVFSIAGLELRPLERFQKALEHAQVREKDLIVISGDLAAWDPQETIYSKIVAALKPYQAKKLIFAGNHDCPQMIHQFFETPLKFGKTCGKYSWNDWNLFYLDSSAYEVSEEQLLWLERNWHNEKSLFFIHHPPCEMKPNWMDKNYPLKKREALWNIIEEKKITPVFCGHYHSSDYRKENGIEVFLTKSTLYQIEDEGEKRKTIDEIGYREILLLSSGEVKTNEKVVL